MKKQISLVIILSVANMFFLSCDEDNPTKPASGSYPTASFTVTPNSGDTATLFIFDASACSDKQDTASALQVRWDWENDGTWDTDYSATKTITHQYVKAGAITIKLKVRDTDGLTAMCTRQIFVDEPSGATGTMTDFDGNVYRTIKIGTQWWMAENLKVTHYRNGDEIAQATLRMEWENISTGAYCTYQNDANNTAIYGLLYNWFAVNDSRKIAPQGWHVPRDEEWKKLEMFLGMKQSSADSLYWRGADEGGKLKATGTTYWNAPNKGATDESGFSALPGGYCDICLCFDLLGNSAIFWSSTEFNSDGVWYRLMNMNSSKINRNNDCVKTQGFSVRLIKNS